MKDKPVTKEKYRPLRFLSPRGGALIEISGIKIKIMEEIALNFLAKKGLLAGLVTGGSIVISKIPATAVSTYLRDAFPQNLPDLEKKFYPSWWRKNIFRSMRPKPEISISSFRR